MSLEYSWFITPENESIPTLIQSGIENVLPNSLTTRGDQIFVEVRAFDGLEWSSTVTSNQVVVLNKAPNQPTVQINGPSSIDGELVCQLESSADPDGDALNTTLEWIDPNQNVVPGTLEGNTYTLNNPNVEGSWTCRATSSDGQYAVTGEDTVQVYGNCATEMTDWGQISTSILEHVELLPATS